MGTCEVGSNWVLLWASWVVHGISACIRGELFLGGTFPFGAMEN